MTEPRNTDRCMHCNHWRFYHFHGQCLGPDGADLNEDCECTSFREKDE